MSRAGIDMVYLNLRPDAFRVHDVSGFGHKKPTLPYGQAPEVWGYSVTGQELTGKLLVNRGDGGGHCATVEVDQRGLHIQLNPSKLQHPYELTADMVGPIEQVKGLLKHLTVDADIETATLSRVDISKQAVMPDPVVAYASAFSVIQGRRAKHRVQYPDGFTVGNKSRSLTFYDKQKERMQAGVSGVPENLLRAEARYHGKEVIGNTNTGIGAGTVKDLLTMDADYLTERYNTYLLRDVFRTSSGTQLAINFGNGMKTLEAVMHRNNGRPGQAIKAMMQCYGIDGMIADFGSLDGIVEALRMQGVPKASLYRYRAEFGRMLELQRDIARYRKDAGGIGKAIDLLIRTFAA